MTTPRSRPERPAGARAKGPGILARQPALDRWLHVSWVVLVVASAVRYLDGHGLGDRAMVVLPGAALLLVVYAVGLRARGGRAIWWLAILVTIWIVLALLAPSFSWAAVPLVFVALRVLPFRTAVGVTALLVAVVAVAWSRMTGVLDPTVVLGPVCIAVLSVTAYRALERDAVVRRALLADLEETQEELADAERRAGVAAERARLSREIHDSVAQSLTSINLLLQAADHDRDTRPDAAHRHVTQAAATARSSLDEVRRVVRDLAPADLAGGGGSALVDTIRRVADETARASGLRVTVHAHGDPASVSGTVATAVLRTVRGALSNVVEHAQADAATVSVTFLDSTVSVDVKDEGVGFDPEGTGRRGVRGHGLAGMRARAQELGGELVVESGPGEGAVVAARFPRVWARD